MNFSNENYCSIKECLADVTISVNDESMTLLSPGFYSRQIRKAMEELSFSTYFNVVYLDLDIPIDLNLPIPKNMWNITDLFVYLKSVVDCSETTCDNCSIDGMVRVFYKRQYISKGKDFGYTARSHEDNVNDPFVVNPGTATNLLWYNVIEGVIMLSDGCKDYDKIRIVANGLVAADIGEAKIIPPFVREAVILYAVEKAAFALKARDVKYRPIWVDANSALYTKKSTNTVSVWDQALYLLKRRDNKERSDFITYLGRMNY